MTGLSVRERASPNHATRGDRARIDMLVLHYTGMRSAGEALDRLCDPAARVSAHYVIEEDGTLWRLVPEAERAFHAGSSCWEGENDLNRVSIGIEIVNPGHEWGYRPFPEAQMRVLEALCGDIVARHPIPAHRIVAHSDIAPERKTDPGELFDWPRLARAGIGLWPQPHAPVTTGEADRAGAIEDLSKIGYCVAANAAAPAVTAFQRRFRPARVDGVIDDETAIRLAEVRTSYTLSRNGAA